MYRCVTQTSAYQNAISSAIIVKVITSSRLSVSAFQNQNLYGGYFHDNHTVYEILSSVYVNRLNI